jgi:hypothetical protein
MKKFIYTLVLFISTAGSLCAQERTNTEKTFDIPDGWFKRRFFVDLGRGNKIRIDMDNMSDMQKVINIDSIITTLLHDIAALKDSLGDELAVRRIDYLPDSNGGKKVRIQQFRPKGSSFLVTDGDVSALKLEQDTVTIIGVVHYTAKYTMRKAFAATRHYRVSFYVNRLEELGGYIGKGLNEKMEAISKNRNAKIPWSKSPADGMYHMHGDHTISSRQPAGYMYGAGDYVNFYITVNAENYKNLFVPSVSAGAKFIFSNGYFKREIGLTSDMYFTFAKNSQGVTKTSINNFINLTWGQGVVKGDPRAESHLLFIMSLGYLARPSGDDFDKRSWRLGAGRLSLFGGKTRIEPAIFFHDLFKNTTPSIRISQGF